MDLPLFTIAVFKLLQLNYKAHLSRTIFSNFFSIPNTYKFSYKHQNYNHQVRIFSYLGEKKLSNTNKKQIKKQKQIS